MQSSGQEESTCQRVNRKINRSCVELQHSALFVGEHGKARLKEPEVNSKDNFKGHSFRNKTRRRQSTAGKGFVSGNKFSPVL